MLEVTDLTKHFGRFCALDGLCMTVPTGAVYGLIGPNGAGKSTLLRHLTGAFRPERGKVLLDGEPVYENPAAKARMAYIPDELFFYRASSMAGMARFYSGLYGHFDWMRLSRMAQALGLDTGKPLRAFSKGMQKQAAFVLAVSLRPDVLVLDEPVDGLDPVMRRQLWSLILQDVAERSTTVVVSSHNLRELEDVCDHVGILHRGKLLLERDLGQLQDTLVKVQVLLPENAALPPELPVLHASSSGRMRTLILQSSREAAAETLAPCRPEYFEAVPLSLEELFIYELGGADYEVKKILL